MRENEVKVGTKQEQRDKIRKRYQKAENADVTVIPAKPQKNPFDTEEECRVAVYARVSTDSPDQTSSYELQKNYYENMIQRNPSWVLVGIYADEGISGTSLNHRDEFQRLIKDCMANKIDLVVTKSVSRFARNTEDCVHYVNQLKNKRPPTGILFEEQGMYTLSENVDMTLSMSASMAQEESHIKSVSMNRSYDMRFSMNIFLIPVLLGYDHDEDGNLVINPSEAKTVRLIFLMYLCGYRFSEIAEEMTRLKRITKIGNEVWGTGSIYGILRNERYCGDVLARKTFTPNYLDHKSAKNNGDKPQYYVKDNHEAIIPREVYKTVQEIMDQAKYGYRNGTPGLKVIGKGVLKGFVQMNPYWTGYNEDDYLNACQSILSDKDYLNPIIQVRKEAGEYDLRSFQVTREQFLTDARRISASVSADCIRFSYDALKELSGVAYIELLFHPFFRMLIVRKSDKSEKHSMKWSRYSKGKQRPHKIKGNAFLPVIYRLSEWDEKQRYTLTGFVKEQNGVKILVFYTEEAEKRIYENGKMSVAYKKEWIESFGDRYLKFLARTQAMFDPKKDWEITERGEIADDSKFRLRPITEYQEEMWKLQAELEAEISGQGEATKTEQQQDFGLPLRGEGVAEGDG